MKYINVFMALIGGLVLSGCVEIDGYHRRPVVENEIEEDAYENKYANRYVGSSSSTLGNQHDLDVSKSEIEYTDISLPPCQNETIVAVYDEKTPYYVPACMDYVDVQEWGSIQQVVSDDEQSVENDEDIDVNAIEGDFPEVEDNKYSRKQVLFQNLKTRVLAYCRGDDEQIAKCIEKLECSGYVRLTEVPHMSAKYDVLQKGSYPTRRWRKGESVPRW